MAGNLSSFVVKMDIDNPGNLKRSNSAPMINEINARSVSSSSTSTPNTASRSSSPCNLFACNTVQSRTRRFSASFSPHHTPASSPRLTPRVSQLRQEECVDREAAHEKELHSAMVMSQSWEDLTVDPASKSDDGNKSVRMLDPLHVSLPCGPPLCSSPSPTRNLSRQCFSPSVSMWKTSLSPSPTRKAFCTRSLSPVAMRPSSLGSVKRKFELDDNEPPAKRGGLLIAQSRLEVNSISPLPGSLSSVGTPESVSSADSPGGFTFRPVDTPSASPLPSPQQPTPRPPPPLTDHPDHPMQDLTKNAS